LKEAVEGHRLKARLPRRVLQLATLLVLVAVPYFTSNRLDLSPSRIVQGQLPPPRVFPVSGDTWSFSAGEFTLLHPVAFAEEALSSKVFYVPMLTAVLLPLLATVVLGRVFCSWMCPVGFVLELNQWTNGLLKKSGIHRGLRIRDFRYALLALSMILAFLLAFPLISVFDPPHMLGRELMYVFTHEELSLSGTGFLLGILLFETFSTSRAWCSCFCPSGGALSIIGARRAWRINMESDKCTQCLKCDETCPYGLEPMGLALGRGFDWAKCDNCGLCRDACPFKAITYRFTAKGR
jgi:ferredoxin-type protein NapH